MKNHSSEEEQQEKEEEENLLLRDLFNSFKTIVEKCNEELLEADGNHFSIITESITKLKALRITEEKVRDYMELIKLVNTFEKHLQTTQKNIQEINTKVDEIYATRKQLQIPEEQDNSLSRTLILFRYKLLL